MFNKKLGLMILFILVLIIIPSSFAQNNTDKLQTDDNLIEVTGTANQEIISYSEDNAPKGVDYYFNSSSDEDGDGTIDNPYNILNTNRLKTSSTIHLANGEYNLTSGKSLNKVTIIGENPEKTIIRYTGTGSVGRFYVDIDNYVKLQNVTLIGFNIDLEGATLQGSNTIFKNSKAFATTSEATNLVNSASNSFGGAIYAYSYTSYSSSYISTVILDSCTFENNTGEYGGAIFIESGTLEITNSTFINNYAYNYGGAIAGISDVSLRIKNSKFINDTSLNDAGGAIYVLHSMLSANNVTIINCSSTFGPAVTALNSTTAFVYLNAINNTAKYEGGAIYQIYNGISISDSNFINNTARNGGAVYVDDVEIFKLTYNNFEKNSAIQTAGAVYALLARNTNINNNNYNSNKAENHDDYYETQNIIMVIGDGNYTIYNNNYTFDGVLPSSYDLRDYNLVTPVRDQQSGGNCWAFGSIAALESAILKASGENLDLSEENMKNLMQLYSDYGWAGIETNDGGYDEMAIGYFTSWLGPVYEDIEEYDDYSMVSPLLNSITHIQNIKFIGRDNYTDNNGIKEAIMKYGAVSTGIYYDSTYYNSIKHSYYYYGSGYSNHAVAIVGWDDDYSLNNFYYKPAGNGAWIVKNSWGDSWGEDGYFYVSYYDTQFAKVGVPDYNYVFVLNDTVKYDKNYQYDPIGRTDYFLTGENTIWVENIFNSTDNELLAAVSTYFRKTTDYELFIYVNDQLALNKNGTCLPGYTTIDLGEQISISKEDIFKVMFKLSAINDVEFAISEKISANKLTYAPGVSLFSMDGVNWTDLYDYAFEIEKDGGHYYSSQVAAIKAFTILYELKPFIQLNTSNDYNNVNITAFVHDQYNNIIHSGELTFIVENTNYTVEIKNGIANLNYIFNNTGLFTVDSIFKNANSSVDLNISNININLNSTINVDKNNALINFTSPFNINTNLKIKVNSKEYSIDLTNGKGILKLDDLDFGYYDVNADVVDDIYISNILSGFNITVSKTDIIADNYISYYGSENNYSIILKDIYGNPVSNRQVSFILDGKSYTSKTNDNGIAYIIAKLTDKTSYKLNILFYGDDSYFAANKTINIDVNSTVKFTNSNYLINTPYNIALLDKTGNPLSKTQVKLSVNNVDYWFVSDENGTISQNVNLEIGNYDISITNPESGEKITKNVNVVSRIMENKNINMYYLSGASYKVLVYGDDGNPAGANEEVVFKINGKTYKRNTDSNGYASLTLSIKPKTYTITATYKEASVSNKVVIKPVLTAKNISKKKAKTIKFRAKLVNTKGKVVSGKKITFKFKGKKYTAKTNKKGIATLSLKNLKVGKYSVTTKYGKSTIKNTIKIKK